MEIRFYCCVNCVTYSLKVLLSIGGSMVNCVLFIKTEAVIRGICIVHNVKINKTLWFSIF